MTIKYRIVTDQANIGIEPLLERAALSNGTYHGCVYVVQSCESETGHGWTFVAAFAHSGQAAHFKSDMVRWPSGAGLGVNQNREIQI